jgi:predicted metal-dependent phosphoesterase TrpH
MANTKGRADLHIHTTFSDGTFTPDEVVGIACRTALRAIAITDHDAVGGVEVAAACGQENGLQVVPGVELSVTHKGHDLHMLGYFIDPHDACLLERLKFFRGVRAQRARRMVEKLRRMGLPISDEEVFGVVGYGAVGRAHIARVMLDKRLVSSFGEAFGRYLGDRAPAYVPKYRMSLREGIALVQGAGGVAVWAHPGVDGRDEMLPQFVSLGLRGLEVLHPDHTYDQRVHYRKLAEHWGLVATGGSDCHGAVKQTPGIGSVAVSYSVVEQLEFLAREIRADLGATAVTEGSVQT